MGGGAFSFPNAADADLLDEVKKPPAALPPLRSHGADAMTLEHPPATTKVWHKRLKRVVTITTADFTPERHERLEDGPIWPSVSQPEGGR